MRNLSRKCDYVQPPLARLCEIAENIMCICIYNALYIYISGRHFLRGVVFNSLSVRGCRVFTFSPLMCMLIFRMNKHILARSFSQSLFEPVALRTSIFRTLVVSCFGTVDTVVVII